MVDGEAANALEGWRVLEVADGVAASVLDALLGLSPDERARRAEVLH